jgi:hypothetical protein
MEIDIDKNDIDDDKNINIDDKNINIDDKNINIDDKNINIDDINNIDKNDDKNNKKSTRKYKDDKNLIGKRSIFSQEQFNKYDIPAREKIKLALTDFIIDNPDIYQQDFIIIDPNYVKYKYIEIQVFTYWDNNNAPNKVFVYERKAKYETDTLFITLNKKMSTCLIFDAKSFKFSKPRRLKKYSREFVYDVPGHRIVTVALEKLTPKFIKMFY